MGGDLLKEGDEVAQRIFVVNGQLRHHFPQRRRYGLLIGAAWNKQKRD
jgi:hypothetical protein